jgi:hypothetical protein
VIRQRLEACRGTVLDGELDGRTHAGRHRAVVTLIVPLHHVVVLYPDDGEAVEIMCAHQQLDVGDMLRHSACRELDHHPTTG